MKAQLNLFPDAKASYQVIDKMKRTISITSNGSKIELECHPTIAEQIATDLYNAIVKGEEQ